MALKHMLAILAWSVLCTGQALACTPILSVGFGGFMAGWLVWLVLALLAGGEDSSRGFWGTVVPLGMFCFAIPTLGLFLFIPALLAIAFPMHLAVEFFDAFRHPQTRSRAWRMFSNGVPLTVMLVLGLSAKAALYGKYGGLRALFWNYFHEAESGFFYTWLLVGAVVLALHRADHRERWPF